MASAIRKNDQNADDLADQETQAIPKRKRILQIIGAIIVTGLALWFLFGVPAYVLFGVFFD